MHEDPRAPYSKPEAVTPVIQWLLIANLSVFLVQQVAGYSMIRWFALQPLEAAYNGAPEFRLWQLLTYAFLHDVRGFAHILFNMFALWMFGSALERLWGSAPFLRFYLFCVVGAAIVQLVFVYVTGSYHATLGASGGVLGLLMAFGMMYPNTMVMLIFPPIPMRAKYFVIVLCVVELGFGFFVSGSPVAHFAHLGGMAFGFLMITYWRGKLPIKPRRQLRR